MLAEHAALLRALAALLAYPDEDLRGGLPDIVHVLRDSGELGESERRALLDLTGILEREDLLESQVRYVDLFDHGRATSLNLFEHVYGDSRERGPALLELRARYTQAGLSQKDYQLPDHLPLMLEYLSCCEPAETVELLGECAHILRRLGAALQHRGSMYVAVVSALLQVAGQAPIDERPTVVPREDIDREWEERPAFETPGNMAATGEA